MLNEDRIILMTKMASYEEQEGKKNMAIGKYFRSDYITIQVLKAVLCATVSYVLVLATYILYHFESFMQEIYSMDLVGFAISIVKSYVVVIVGYGVISYIICSCRYAKAKRSLRSYYQNLKKLNSMYQEQ